MSVASFPYIALVLLLSPCYALCPRGGRPWFLLAASLAFYGSFNLGFLVILLGVILVTYGAGLTLEGDRGRPWLLGLWIAAVLTPLLFYKYFLVWFGARLTELVPVSALSFGGYGSVLIPVGLSFFTFQSLGYIIDVHRKQYRAERDLAHLALFISFFPQLLAGPIERFRR